jgi:protein SCO1/2
MLVFFSYTANPECALIVRKIDTAMRALGSLAAQVMPLMITVDPARDAPERLASYLSKIDSQIAGLTGTNGEITAAASAYNVDYSTPARSGEDVLTHLRFLYLIHLHCRLDALMPLAASAGHLATVLRRRLSAEIPVATSH